VSLLSCAFWREICSCNPVWAVTGNENGIKLATIINETRHDAVTWKKSGSGRVINEFVNQ
jgi:hypothetical protein